MRIIREAVQAVQENLSALFLYVALRLVGHLIKWSLYLAGEQGVFGDLAKDELAEALWPYELALDGGLAVLFAVAFSVAFARMGKEIDKPLWKIQGASEALRRFFSLWFVIVAVAFLSLHAANFAHQNGYTQLAVAFELGLVLPIELLAIPIGACIMFYGKLEWRNLGTILAPLGRQLPMTVMVLLLNLFQLLLLTVVMSVEAETGNGPGTLMTLLKGAVLTIIGGYIDCVVFAGTWLLCMTDRDTEEEPTDFDF